jgi:hypothetical protein
VELAVVVDWEGINAALSCARSHFCAILCAVSKAPFTSEREGDDCGVRAKRSLEK